MTNETTTPKTFADFGLTFQEDTDCVTCNTGSCHNNVTSKKDGDEYNVHISVNFDSNDYWIMATKIPNSDSDEIFQSFENEEDAVKFVCENFDWFKCF